MNKDSKKRDFMKYIILSFLLFLTACAQPPVRADYVLVDKSTNRMYLYQGNEVLKAYNVGFGQNPVGHKQQEGDHRTPEGRYNLVYKNPNSKFYKSIKIDYPNTYDLNNAGLRGVSAGGDIVIHGMPNEVGDYRGPISPRNWTQGCIAVRNNEMEEIWNLIDVPIQIEIRP